MTREAKPSPSELWNQADAEHPDDADARRVRYVELMIEAGHVVEGKPRLSTCIYPPFKDLL